MNKKQPNYNTDMRKYGRRAAAATRARNLLLIEGEHVTMGDIAKRLGVHDKMARSRYDAAKVRDGAITWARLRGED